VRKTIDTMKKEHIPTIFSESTISDKPARQVARKPAPTMAACCMSTPERRRWPGADLPRSAARHHANHRPGHQRRDEETAMNADMPGLAVNRVSVTYRNGHTALRDASFSVPRGSIAALVGINGSGKSTLFKALMGFVRLSHGEIAILGQPVHRALRQNLVAYVPQSEEVDWSFPVLVEDVVMMGRYGHMGWLRRAKAARSGSGRCRAGPRRDERVSPPANRRALRRAEKARVPCPRYRSAGQGHSAG
jgi:hypothetical protein